MEENEIGYDYKGTKAFELKNGNCFIKKYDNGIGQLYLKVNI